MQDITPQAFERAKALLPSQLMEGKVSRKQDPETLQNSFLFVQGKWYAMARHSVLGSGAFARCKWVQDEAGQKFAVKIGKINLNECRLLHTVGHNLGYIYNDNQLVSDSSSSEDSKYKKNYVIMPLFLGVDLWCLLESQLTIKQSWSAMGRPKLLTVQQRLTLALGIAKALRFLHHFGSIRIIHRDLKPENIMVNVYEGEIMSVNVIDYGLAMEYQPGRPLVGYENRVVGTRSYIAPEVAFADICWNLEKASSVLSQYMRFLTLGASYTTPGESDRLLRLKKGILWYKEHYGLEDPFILNYSDATDIYSFAGIMDDLELSSVLQEAGLDSIYSHQPLIRMDFKQATSKISNILKQEYSAPVNTQTQEVAVGDEKWGKDLLPSALQGIYKAVLQAVSDYNQHFIQKGSRLFGQWHHSSEGVERGKQLLNELLCCQSLDQAQLLIQKFLAAKGGKRPHSLKTLVKARVQKLKEFSDFNWEANVPQSNKSQACVVQSV